METENSSWGFYGTRKRNQNRAPNDDRDGKTDKEFSEAAHAIAKFQGMTLEEARDFLDSTRGRHLADQIDGMDWDRAVRFMQNNKKKSYVLRQVQAHKRGSRLSRPVRSPGEMAKERWDRTAREWRSEVNSAVIDRAKQTGTLDLGYPEFDPDQNRGEDGQWTSGGGGAKVGPEGPYQRLPTGHRARAAKPTPPDSSPPSSSKPGSQRLGKDAVVHWDAKSADFAKRYISMKRGDVRPGGPSAKDLAAQEKFWSRFTDESVKSGFAGSGATRYFDQKTGKIYLVTRRASGKGFYGTDHTISFEESSGAKED